jgi:ATP-dependent Lhr-like helicase
MDAVPEVTTARARDPLEGFHPAIAEWFRRRFAGGPTEAQAKGWASIAAGLDTLIAAPTGSGKTLAGFLVAIDQCLRAAGEDGEEVGDRTEVLYVSPLRALTVDIRENLEGPLREIVAIARELGLPAREIRVAVRNGDTPPAARAAMLRRPPHIVVTTPESLYLLVTSERGRAMLATTHTVIVDEIHALARDKRGSHLALSLERLDRCCAVAGSGRAAAGEVAEGTGRVGRPVRIGLSATQRPISTVARLLVGTGPGRAAPDGSPVCSIVDTGHRRQLDVAIELPDDELGAVATIEQLDQVIDLIASHVRSHTSTLVFVNTRRMAERIAHVLAEKIGEGSVAAHHGSLSTDRRLRVESRLRAGDLRALVATASLELGIDVGPVDLVCQLGSPRSIATFLQRVGRAEHRLRGVPKGRLYPLTRDELVECTALLAAVRAGDLDRVCPPDKPLDILAQQIVAEVAAAGDDGFAEAELLALVRSAAPFAGVTEDEFGELLELLSEGVMTGRGRRGAHLHRDRVNNVVRARRGARISAVTSGGAIPEVADYRVVLEPDDTLIGTVNEDWAIESMAGDVFLLGTSSWRIRRIEAGTVRVIDANGAPPTVPFWLGEAPARTNELADAVSSLSAAVDATLVVGGSGRLPSSPAGSQGGVSGDTGRTSAREYVQASAGVSADVAAQLVSYLAAGRDALGLLPTKQDLVFERFFDDTGGMQLVLHSPYGGRINRGLGLALRKRFCRSFDFELQAAANDDAVVLSLGPQHSFPMEDLAHFLSARTVGDVLAQALLVTPMFTARWRWNLTRSLIAPRWRSGRRVPPAIQRMEADDLMAAIFPALAACQENTTGAIEIPDHPIVRQTMKDCFTEAVDLAGIEALLGRIADSDVRVHYRDLVEPSPLAHEILNGRPYTFLDDAPLEERRTRAIQLRRGIPVEEGLNAIDPEALAQVREEAGSAPRDAEELHDLLDSMVLMVPDPALDEQFEQLVAAGRAMLARPDTARPADEPGGPARWCATERRLDVEALWPAVSFAPDNPPIEDARSPGQPDPEVSAARALRGLLDVSGPMTSGQIADHLLVNESTVAVAVARLEGEGFLLRGHFDAAPVVERNDGGQVVEQVCARRLLARAHGLSRDRRRRSVRAASPQSLMRFLLSWQHVAPGSHLHGPGGLSEVIEQLQGFELAVGAFEESVFPARVSGYQPPLLDQLCQQGEVAWGRISSRESREEPADQGRNRDREGRGGSERPGGEAAGLVRRAGSPPSRATPVTFVRREDLDWLLAVMRGERAPAVPPVGGVAEVVAALESRGALFFADLCTATRRLPSDVAEALWEAVARGIVTADEFKAVRSLLGGSSWRSNGRSSQRSFERMHAANNRRARPGMPRRRMSRPALSGGRWALLVPPGPAGPAGPDAMEAVPGPGDLPHPGDAPDLAGRPDGMDADELAEAAAGQLLLRWGVVFRDLMVREQLAIPWRDLLFAMRRLEARGVVRGGRFVTGFSGEQFALPEAVEELRRTDSRELDGSVVTISAADPLNLAGIVTPGPRVPALRTRRITLLDGVAVEDVESSGDKGGAGSAASRRQRAGTTAGSGDAPRTRQGGAPLAERGEAPPV